MGVTARQSAQLRRSGTDWYRIQNLDVGTAEIVIYDEIGYLGVTAQSFIDELRAVEAGEMVLRINSPGGEIFDGIAIMNALRSHPAHVTAYVDGVAASIASVIAMAGDRVVMMPHSQMMIHDGSGLCVGDAADMQDMADLLNRQSDNIARVYRDKAGGQAKTWRKRMQAETWYSAEEAVRAGLADEVARQPPRRSDEEMYNRSWDLSVYRYAGREEAPEPPLTNEGQPPGEEEEREEGPGDEPMTDRAIGPHESETAEGEWDAGENTSRLPSPVPLDTVAAVYALYDSDRVEDGAVPKDACSLPHHFVSEDGTPGAASMNGVRAALSRLPQTEGYSAEELETARTHLRQHLEDGGGGEEEEGEPEARQSAELTGWSPDLFRTAVAKASGLPPEDLPATFRNAVTAAAGSAPAVAARAEQPPQALGWQPAPATDEPGQREESLHDLLRAAITREASNAPAVITKPAPEPERDPYDSTVVIRALREANQ